jgi:hypothetical protein
LACSLLVIIFIIPLLLPLYKKQSFGAKDKNNNKKKRLREDKKYLSANTSCFCPQILLDRSEDKQLTL